MPLLKVAVIGATGGTGRAVIQNTLAAGHTIRRRTNIKYPNDD